MTTTTDYERGGAYYIASGPDTGEEVVYQGLLEIDGEEREMIMFPHVRQWPPRPQEPLGERTLTPRMVTCEEGHEYHLMVECFPVAAQCPVCGPGDVEDYFRRQNYDLWHTGGGCTAWAWEYDRDGGGYWLIMVTDDASAPRKREELFEPCVGIYEIDASGDYVDDNGLWCGGWEDEDNDAKLATLEIPEPVRRRVEEALAVLKGTYEEEDED